MTNSFSKMFWAGSLAIGAITDVWALQQQVFVPEQTSLLQRGRGDPVHFSPFELGNNDDQFYLHGDNKIWATYEKGVGDHDPDGFLPTGKFIDNEGTIVSGLGVDSYAIGMPCHWATGVGTLFQQRNLLGTGDRFVQSVYGQPDTIAACPVLENDRTSDTNQLKKNRYFGLAIEAEAPRRKIQSISRNILSPFEKQHEVKFWAVYGNGSPGQLEGHPTGHIAFQAFRESKYFNPNDYEIALPCRWATRNTKLFTHRRRNIMGSRFRQSRGWNNPDTVAACPMVLKLDPIWRTLHELAKRHKLLSLKQFSSQASRSGVQKSYFHDFNASEFKQFVLQKDARREVVFFEQFSRHHPLLGINVSDVACTKLSGGSQGTVWRCGIPGDAVNDWTVKKFHTAVNLERELAVSDALSHRMKNFQHSESDQQNSKFPNGEYLGIQKVFRVDIGHESRLVSRYGGHPLNKNIFNSDSFVGALSLSDRSKCVRRWILQFLDILDVFFRCGVVHDDFTSDNILINRSTSDTCGQLSIIDYGRSFVWGGVPLSGPPGSQSQIDTEQQFLKQHANDRDAASAMFNIMSYMIDSHDISYKFQDLFTDPRKTFSDIVNSAKDEVQHYPPLLDGVTIPYADRVWQKFAKRWKRGGEEYYHIDFSPIDVTDVDAGFKLDWQLKNTGAAYVCFPKDTNYSKEQKEKFAEIAFEQDHMTTTNTIERRKIFFGQNRRQPRFLSSIFGDPDDLTQIKAPKPHEREADWESPINPLSEDSEQKKQLLIQSDFRNVAREEKKHGEQVAELLNQLPLKDSEFREREYNVGEGIKMASCSSNYYKKNENDSELCVPHFDDAMFVLLDVLGHDGYQIAFNSDHEPYRPNFQTDPIWAWVNYGHKETRNDCRLMNIGRDFSEHFDSDYVPTWHRVLQAPSQDHIKVRRSLAYSFNYPIKNDSPSRSLLPDSSRENSPHGGSPR